MCGSFCHAQFRTVTVANANNQPVPTTVQNTPAVTVSGTPNVSVANTPNVNVANTPTVGIDPLKNTVTVGNAIDAPLPVRNNDDPARHFYRAEASGCFQSSDEVQLDIDPSVPQGKVLVLDFVSVWTHVPPNTFVTRTLFEISTNFIMNFKSEFTGSNFFGNSYGVAQPVQIYIKPGETLRFLDSIDNVASCSGNFAHVVLMGHFVDVP